MKFTIMNFNRLFEDWEKFLSDPPLATVVLDRFVHRAEIIRITGRSYQLKDVAINDRVDTKKKTKNYNQTGKQRASEHHLPLDFTDKLAVGRHLRAWWKPILALTLVRQSRPTSFANRESRHLFVKNLLELLSVRKYIKGT